MNNRTRKTGLENQLFSDENFSYEKLKELKLKLDERQSEILKQEKQIEDARKMITRNVLDLEKRELDLENYSIEKELLLKEKGILDEEKLKLNNLVDQIKAQNETLIKQVNELKIQKAKDGVESVSELKIEIE